MPPTLRRGMHRRLLYVQSSLSHMGGGRDQHEGRDSSKKSQASDGRAWTAAAVWPGQVIRAQALAALTTSSSHRTDAGSSGRVKTGSKSLAPTFYKEGPLLAETGLRIWGGLQDSQRGCKHRAC
ncbi:hypothetical protein FKM82_031261 [Ascaphus truei]